MLKLVYRGHRQPGMSVEEFERYWLDDHAPLITEHNPAPSAG